MRRIIELAVVGLVVVAGAISPAARAAPINLLQHFNVFPDGAAIAFGSDGSTATFTESADPMGPFEIILYNDPGFGDANVIVGGPGISLLFDFDFQKDPTADNEDTFSARLFDVEADPEDSGAYFLEIVLIDAAETGTRIIDLSPYAGKLLGLEFGLFSDLLDDTLGPLMTTVTLSNVRLTGIAEPATWLLLLMSVLGVGVIRRPDI